MEEQTERKCSNCGAPLDAYSYTCQFCSFVILDRVKRTPDNPADMTFQESVDITETNLNLIHEIPIPSFGRALTDVIRIYIIIITLGIAAIFWKRPKIRFNKSNYEKLKHIVIRNIGFIKASAKGSPDLLSHVGVLEKELQQSDKKIRNGIVVRVLTYILIPLAYIIFLQTSNTDTKRTDTVSVQPVMSTVKTDDSVLRDLLTVMPDSCRIQIKDSVLKLYTLSVIIKKREPIDSMRLRNLEIRACFVDNPKKGLDANCCHTLLLSFDELAKFKKYAQNKDILSDTLIFKLDKEDRRYFNKSSISCSKDFIITIKN